ncbi:AhpC-TSA-domain-containing protein [Choiromyces venosus 120613-1]|uniref:thioredoxin-dependent peroxiredoxin n=1 Tax=Choiromyces venosus 120613-1 TaxID=1336337 RepID=A0A3N4IUN1_9PEZI|nr:AhpC-TSA-domain-containing protein [Choiromyces venosus 120613-1]
MSEPVLRRSGRNIAKKEAASAAPPAPAPVPKKRASAEPKKPAAKKAKTAVDKAAAVVKNAVGKDKKEETSNKKKAEAAAAAAAGEASAAAAEEKVAPAATASSSSAAAAVATTSTVVAPPAAKPAAKAKGGKAKAKKADAAEEAAVALKEGDLLPNTLPEVQTHDGGKTTLTAILAKASKGIVVFAYPKASTPECTSQACLFRDNYASFTDAGYAVYGLSGDQPGANEKFRNKQNLTYTLLCDPTYELHEKLGIKKSPKGTIRSVIVIEKAASTDNANPGKILRKTKASAVLSLQIAKEVVGIDGGAVAAAGKKEKEVEGNAGKKEKEKEKEKAGDGDVTLPDAGAEGEGA